MAANKIPLPHFLNLPLPNIPLPSNPSSPLVFKLSLSADLFDELLRMDAEVEEGEEGGLRLEFDSDPKPRLHLSPSRSLLLAPPRNGPPRTNKPEELYHHFPSPQLAGLLRIPSGTPVYDLQPLPAPPAVSQPSREPVLAPPRPLPEPKPSRPQPDSTQREREKLAGQRLKDKRAEEDRKKKEKQMVLLPNPVPGPPPPAPVPRKTRQPKAKAAPKKAPPPALPPVPPKPLQAAIPPRPAPRRALPGSQSGKQLASEHNYHLAAAPAPKPSVEPPPVQPPTPPVTYKRSSSHKRAKPPSLSPPDPSSVPASEPPSATKLSTSTGLSSLSEEGEPDQRPPPPDPRPPSPQRTDSASSLRAPALHRPDSASSNRASPKPLITDARDPDKSSGPPAAKRLPQKPAPPAVAPCPPEPVPQAPPSPSRKRKSEALAPMATATGPSRPKKIVKREGADRRIRPGPGSAAPLPPAPLPVPVEEPRKPMITIKKVAVPVVAERTPGTYLPKKRALDPDEPSQSASAAVGMAAKRVRADEGVPPPALPTIRKVARVPETSGAVGHETQSNGTGKRVKKKKKVKQPIDYTSSEPEEGEEGEEDERGASAARARAKMGRNQQLDPRRVGERENSLDTRDGGRSGREALRSEREPLRAERESAREQERESARVERERELAREREAARAERERENARAERERVERERETARAEREAARVERERVEQEREAARVEREREDARAEREAARIERERETARVGREAVRAAREAARGEREREVARVGRERDSARVERERERESVRADRDRDSGRLERERESLRAEREREPKRRDVPARRLVPRDGSRETSRDPSSQQASPSLATTHNRAPMRSTQPGKSQHPISEEQQTYNRSRLQFLKLLRHYELVCDRIEGMKSGKIKINSLGEVEELMDECKGLEGELERGVRRVCEVADVLIGVGG